MTAAGSIAALVGLGAFVRNGRRKSFLRPPGGQDEETFIARCIKCDRCRSVCPRSAIGVVPASDGLLEARTPVMKYHIGSCDFCNKCVGVCPTEALQPFDIKSVKIGIAVVTDRCIAWDSGGCTVCGRECSYGAISFDAQKRPVVDQAKCNGCGVCENVCPALVLRSYVGGTVRGIEVRPVHDRGTR